MRSEFLMTDSVTNVMRCSLEKKVTTVSKEPIASMFGPDGKG